jgi:hypothetical protein
VRSQRFAFWAAARWNSCGHAADKGDEMSWKVEVVMDDSGEWEGDSLRFATEQEALAYARELEFCCSAIRDKRIVKSADSVNHRWSAHAVRTINTTSSGP